MLNLESNKILVEILQNACIFFTIICCASAASPKDIQCYTCKSAVNPNCGDPFNNVTMGGSLVKCNQLRSNGSDYEHLIPYWELNGWTMNDAPMFCRKIVQEVEDDTRIIRECAFLDDPKITEREENEKCIPRAGTYHIKYETCYCDKTGCNSARTSYSNDMIALALSTLIAAALLK